MLIRWRYQNKEQTLSTVKTEVFIGRPNPHLATDLDLTPDETVSRTHARVWLENGKLWIEDLASKWGTFVNGEKIEGSRELLAGDRVRIGETEIEISQ
jgi:pSer/pThr/pTyr-binding forkhead associated (FHA) protein